MKNAKPSFDEYYLELQKSDPGLRKEMDAALADRVANESVGGGPDDDLLLTREAIVLTTGRPVLDIKSGAMVVEFSDVESQIWRDA